MLALAKQRSAPASATPFSQATDSVAGAAGQLQESTRELIPDQAAAYIPPGWLDYGLALAVLCAAVLLRWLALLILGGFRRRAAAASGELPLRLLNLLGRMLSVGLLLGGLFVALSFISVPGEPDAIHRAIWRGFVSCAIAAAAVLLYSLGEVLLSRSALTEPQGHGALLDRRLAPLIRDILKVGLIVSAIAAGLSVWGYSPATLLAGVGLGGLAVAFAAQDTIASIFGSFTIYTDRPFRIGDWVKLGDTEGIVEEIGIRSTRIRCFDKSLVSIPNKSVTGESIQNFSAMTQRRIRLEFPLDPATPPALLRSALEAMRAALAAQPQLDPAGAFVRLSGIDALGIGVLVFAFTRDADYQGFLAAQEELILDILTRLAELGVELAQDPRRGR